MSAAFDDCRAEARVFLRRRRLLNLILAAAWFLFLAVLAIFFLK